MNRLQVLILAGGEGKRMGQEIPKVLQPFLDQPMIIRLLTSVCGLLPDKIIVVVGRHENKITSTIRDATPPFPPIDFIRQDLPLGTADAVRCALPGLSEGYVLILNADTPLVSTALLQTFVDQPGNKLMTATIDDPTGYGRVICDEKGNVVKIMEDKDCPVKWKDVTTINAGIYLFETRVLQDSIPLIRNNNQQGEYYLTDIFKHVPVQIQSFTVPKEHHHEIHGINTREQLIALEQLYTNETLNKN